MKEFEREPIVYIAGPYTANPEKCVEDVMIAAELTLEHGGVPYLPHLTHLWHRSIPHVWEFWIAYDLRILSEFETVIALRLPGDSVGADIEEFILRQIDKPIVRLEEVTNERFNFKDFLISRTF
jgi:hypothetical protein